MSCIRCILKLILALVIIAGLILAAIFIGSAVQKGKAKKATDITPLYTNGRVCAFTKYANGTTIFNSYNSTFAAISTRSPTAAPVAGATAAPTASPTNKTTVIGQCGDCGKCSNLDDYEAFVASAKESNGTQFYENLGSCSVRSIAGRSYVSSCLKKNFGFTSDCSNCYADFLSCGFKKCGFTCVSTAILKEKWITKQEINDCLFCAQRMCGASLLSCAGADYQRLNIPLPITVPGAQQCNLTQVNWMSYNFSAT